MDRAESFSRRHGYGAPEADITIREDAPAAIRSAVIALARSFGLTPNSLRSEICAELLCTPDRDNWSSDNVSREVEYLIDDAPWYRVYDIAERLHHVLENESMGNEERFAKRLNEVFREIGVGYEMRDGRIVGRGSLAFRDATEEAIRMMTAAHKPTAAGEMKQALSDITRRPPDITGAVQHGMNALECTARDVTGRSTDTLGTILPMLALPKPLDQAVEKLWGFASQRGRHIAEGLDPTFEDAELVVTVASAVSVYLLRKRSPHE